MKLYSKWPKRKDGFSKHIPVEVEIELSNYKRIARYCH